MEKKFRDLTSVERIAIIKARTASKNDAFLNNVRVLQRVDHKIEDIQDQAKKDFLTAFFAECKDPAHVAAATIYKGALMQDRPLFGTSQDNLIELLKADPDNTVEKHKYLKATPTTKETGKVTAKLGRVTASLYDHDIYQLWNSSGRGKAAGFAILDPVVLELMNLSKEELLAQYKDLQVFCDNYSIPKDWIFNSVGEMRLEKEKIKNQIEHIKCFPEENAYVGYFEESYNPYEDIDALLKDWTPDPYSDYDEPIALIIKNSYPLLIPVVLKNSDVPSEIAKTKDQNPVGKHENIRNATITCLSIVEPTVKHPSKEDQNDLYKFLNEERVQLLKDWYDEAKRYDISSFSNAFRNYMAQSFIQFMKDCNYDQENFVLDLDEVLKKPKLSAFNGLAKKCFLDCAKENRLFVI